MRILSWLKGCGPEGVIWGFWPRKKDGSYTGREKDMSGLLSLKEGNVCGV